MLLMEQKFQVPAASKKIACLIEKNMPSERMQEILKQAQALRDAGNQVNTAVMKKNKKFQKEQLKEEGYEEILDFYREGL